MNDVNADLIFKAFDAVKKKESTDGGVDLLAIVKKISRNRKKGQIPE